MCRRLLVAAMIVLPIRTSIELPLLTTPGFGASTLAFFSLLFCEHLIAVEEAVTEDSKPYR
jgi:hypothetical protein